MAWRAFFIKDLILDLTSLLRSRAFTLWRCLFRAEVWTIKESSKNELVISNTGRARSQRCGYGSARCTRVATDNRCVSCGRYFLKVYFSVVKRPWNLAGASLT